LNSLDGLLFVCLNNGTKPEKNWRKSMKDDVSFLNANGEIVSFGKTLIGKFQRDSELDADKDCKIVFDYSEDGKITSFYFENRKTGKREVYHAV
jgi:hypothetical protein